MRLVKEEASIEWLPGIGFHILLENTTKINLEDFSQWYYSTLWRKEAGQISYKDVPALVQKWLATLECSNG